MIIKMIVVVWLNHLPLPPKIPCVGGGFPQRKRTPSPNPEQQNTQSLISGAEKSLLILLLEIPFIYRRVPNSNRSSIHVYFWPTKIIAKTKQKKRQKEVLLHYQTKYINDHKIELLRVLTPVLF